MEINQSQRTISLKIVYYGPALCGKTTNLIQSFARLKPEQRLTNEIVEIPTESDRTLKYEFAPLSIGKIAGFTAKFMVYTVPGQVFYEASRRLILKGADGVVFVADSQKGKAEENLSSLLEMEKNLEQQNLKLYEDIPMVLQFNKQDRDDAMPIELMANSLRKNDTPYYAASAISGEGVVETFQTIIRMTVANIGLAKTGS